MDRKKNIICRPRQWLSPHSTEKLEIKLNAQEGWISPTVYDLHLLAFADKTKAIKSQGHSEKVVEKKKK